MFAMSLGSLSTGCFCFVILGFGFCCFEFAGFIGSGLLGICVVWELVLLI